MESLFIQLLDVVHLMTGFVVLCHIFKNIITIKNIII